jgi:hypothetical protein
MKRRSFAEGVAVALVAALVSSMVLTLLPALFGLQWTTRLLIAGLGLGYVLYLLHRSQERTGRVVTLAAWLAVGCLSWFLVEDPLLYLAAHLGMVWLVRSLYHQSGPLAALADLALNLFALMAGSWAWLHADSVFLGVWSFFLAQALFVGIPSATARATEAAAQPERRADRFQLAYRSAEAALRKLSSHQRV